MTVDRVLRRSWPTSKLSVRIGPGWRVVSSQREEEGAAASSAPSWSTAATAAVTTAAAGEPALQRRKLQEAAEVGPDLGQPG